MRFPLTYTTCQSPGRGLTLFPLLLILNFDLSMASSHWLLIFRKMVRRIVFFLLDSDSEVARTEADLNSPQIAEARSNILGSRGF